MPYKPGIWRAKPKPKFPFTSSIVSGLRSTSNPVVPFIVACMVVVILWCFYRVYRRSVSGRQGEIVTGILSKLHEKHHGLPKHVETAEAAIRRHLRAGDQEKAKTVYGQLQGRIKNYNKERVRILAEVRMNHPKANIPDWAAHNFECPNMPQISIEADCEKPLESSSDLGAAAPPSSMADKVSVSGSPVSTPSGPTVAETPALMQSSSIASRTLVASSQSDSAAVEDGPDRQPTPDAPPLIRIIKRPLEPDESPSALDVARYEVIDIDSDSDIDSEEPLPAPSLPKQKRTISRANFTPTKRADASAKRPRRNASGHRSPGPPGRRVAARLLNQGPVNPDHDIDEPIASQFEDPADLDYQPTQPRKSRSAKRKRANSVPREAPKSKQARSSSADLGDEEIGHPQDQEDTQDTGAEIFTSPDRRAEANCPHDSMSRCFLRRIKIETAKNPTFRVYSELCRKAHERDDQCVMSTVMTNATCPLWRHLQRAKKRQELQTRQSAFKTLKLPACCDAHDTPWSKGCRLDFVVAGICLLLLDDHNGDEDQVCKMIDTRFSIDDTMPWHCAHRCHQRNCVNFYHVFFQLGRVNIVGNCQKHAHYLYDSKAIIPKHCRASACRDYGKPCLLRNAVKSEVQITAENFLLVNAADDATFDDLPDELVGERLEGVSDSEGLARLGLPADLNFISFDDLGNCTMFIPPHLERLGRKAARLTRQGYEGKHSEVDGQLYIFELFFNPTEPFLKVKYSIDHELHVLWNLNHNSHDGLLRCKLCHARSGIHAFEEQKMKFSTAAAYLFHVSQHIHMNEYEQLGGNKVLYLVGFDLDYACVEEDQLFLDKFFSLFQRYGQTYSADIKSLRERGLFADAQANRVNILRIAINALLNEQLPFNMTEDHLKELNKRKTT